MRRSPLWSTCGRYQLVQESVTYSRCKNVIVTLGAPPSLQKIGVCPEFGGAIATERPRGRNRRPFIRVMYVSWLSLWGIPPQTRPDLAPTWSALPIQPPTRLDTPLEPPTRLDTPLVQTPQAVPSLWANPTPQAGHFLG